jgi:hypothetical protein
VFTRQQACAASVFVQFRGQCGLARPRVLAGGVIVSREPSIVPYEPGIDHGFYFSNRIRDRVCIPFRSRKVCTMVSGI